MFTSPSKTPPPRRGVGHIPRNDFFIGNDSPQQYQLFGAGGNPQIGSITVRERGIWDARTERFDPASACVGHDPLRTGQSSAVALNFDELNAFDGLLTGAGYNLNSQLTADTEVPRINFGVTPVPVPSTYAMPLAGLMAVGGLARRRRTACGPCPTPSWVVRAAEGLPRRADACG